MLIAGKEDMNNHSIIQHGCKTTFKKSEHTLSPKLVGPMLLWLHLLNMAVLYK